MPLAPLRQHRSITMPHLPQHPAADLSQPAVRRLPGEVVLHIMRFVVEEMPTQTHQLKSYVRKTLPLQQINRRWKLAADWAFGLRLHTYISPPNTGTHDERSPWHVSIHDPVYIHRDYWEFFQGSESLKKPAIYNILNTLTLARVPTLRSISLDLRPYDPISSSSLRKWKTVHAPRLIHTSSILTRMLSATRGLEELNLRISPQQELVDMVEELVAKNTRLRKLTIEVDSAIVAGRNIRPTIRLDRMFPKLVTRAPLERLVIRAPGCNITIRIPYEDQIPFFFHLRSVTEFGMVCASFKTSTTNQWWIYRLFNRIPKIKSCEIAIDVPDSRATTLENVTFPLTPLYSLEKLSIQFAEVDTRLLRSFVANNLFKLRVGSRVPISKWPICDDDHFPRLFVAHICCPGPSALRLLALGIKPCFFRHNLTELHNDQHNHQAPFLAYIKPYARHLRRVPTSQSLTQAMLIPSYTIVSAPVFASSDNHSASSFGVPGVVTAASPATGASSPLTELSTEDESSTPEPTASIVPVVDTSAPAAISSTVLAQASSASATAALSFAHDILSLSGNDSGSSHSTAIPSSAVVLGDTLEGQGDQCAGPSRKRARVSDH
ncbi:hypothetical protein CF319_g5938 [Tilletia indica]|nr:hypothetical protein CF319_g5938 [Tilletia indica]